MLQVSRLGVGGGQRGHQIDRLPGLLAGHGAGAGDPDGLLSMGKADAAGCLQVNALTVRVSRRPCPVSRCWSAIGTCAHGSRLSWAYKVGWLALTDTYRSPPAAATARA
ncbi:hypothetical protein GCM10029963_73660 [Micromonospora andamanensis]|nr:hypothetical protein Vwe01_60180 [Micromonospora andamanensis]